MSRDLFYILRHRRYFIFAHVVEMFNTNMVDMIVTFSNLVN